MSRQSRFVFVSGVLLFVLLVSLARPMAVYAEDGAPPPVTEEPVQPPAEGETEVAPEEADSVSPIAEGEELEDPVGGGEAVTEVPAATEAPVVEEAAVAEAPVVTEEAEAVATEVPGEGDSLSPSADGEGEESSEEVTIGEILEAAPEGTEVVVLDENGEALPLVSTEAAEIVAAADPMWCPVIAGVPTLPGGAGCSPNFGTPQALIDNMDVIDPQTPGLGLYEQPGIIYFTADLTAPGNSFILIRGGLDDDVVSPELYDADYDALKGYDLILQGGWSGVNGDTNFTQTDFGANPVQIGTSANPWIGSVIINDITINGASDTGLRVFTQGDIDLENVTSNNPGELYGAYLATTSGDIRVANSSFNLHSSDGLRTWAVNGSIMLTDVTVTGNGGRGVQGQAGGTGGIRVTGGSFSNNGLDGLWLLSDSGDITLSGVTADDNGFHGALLDTCVLAGGVCTGSGSIVVDSSSFGDGPGIDPIGNFQSGLTVYSAGSVEVTGSDFYQNLGNGLSATAFGGSIRLEGVTAHDNMSDGASLDSAGDVNIRSSIFGGGAGSGNGLSGSGMGLNVFTDGSVTLSGVTVSGNVGDGGAFLSGLGPVDVSGSHFDENTAIGLMVDSDSSITLSQVSANQNGFFGTSLGSAGNIALSNVTASDNGIGGLLAANLNSLTLSSVSANDNGMFGASLGSAGNIVINNSYFDGNASLVPGFGLSIGSNQNITLDHVSASNNLYGYGAILDTFENATVVCSQFQNNNGPGVDGWFVDGTFTLDDVIFSGNVAGDYVYDGTPTILSGGCTVVNKVVNMKDGNKEEPSTGSVLPLHIVPVGGSEQVELDCSAYSGTKLILPNGDRVIFPCPIRDQGLLTGQTQSQLPGPLDDQFGFLSALEVGVLHDGQSVATVAANMTIDFVIPDDQKGADLVILRWDASQSQWVEVPGGYDAGGGRFVVPSNFTGIYVLVTK